MWDDRKHGWIEQSFRSPMVMCVVFSGWWMQVSSLRLLHSVSSERLGPHAPGPPHPLPRRPAGHQWCPVHRRVLCGSLNSQRPHASPTSPDQPGHPDPAVSQLLASFSSFHHYICSLVLFIPLFACFNVQNDFVSVSLKELPAVWNMNTGAQWKNMCWRRTWSKVTPNMFKSVCDQQTGTISFSKKMDVLLLQEARSAQYNVVASCDSWAKGDRASKSRVPSGAS